MAKKSWFLYLLAVILPILVVVGLIILSQTSRAATITWDGGGADNNWSTAANWDGDVAPGVNDVAFFSASSTKNVTLDLATTSVAGINMASGYSGTMTQGTSSIVIGANGWTHASGTFSGGSRSIDINNGSFSLSGGTFIAPSSTPATSSDIFVERDLTISGGTFTATGATTTFDGSDNDDDSTLTCTGTLGGIVALKKSQSFQNSNFTVASGCTIDLGINPTTITGGGIFTNNGTVNASGTWTLNGDGQTTDPGGKLTNNGTITHSGAGWDFNDVSFKNAAGATTTYNGTSITIDRDFQQSGTFDLSGVSITFDGSDLRDKSTVECSGELGRTVIISKMGFQLHNFTVASGCSIDLGLDPTSTIGHGTFTNNGAVNATGTWTFSGSASGGAHQGKLINNGTITHSGAGWDLNNLHLDSGFTNSSGATTTYTGTSITIEGGLNINGSFDLSGKTITFDSASDPEDDSALTCNITLEGNLTVNKTVGGTNFTFNTNCTIQGDFTRTDGAVNASTSPTTLTVEGDFSMSTTDAFGGANLTVTMSGSDAQTFTQNAGSISGPLKVDKSGGRAKLTTALNASSTCNVVEGTFDLDGNNITCDAGWTIENGGVLELFGSETSSSTPTLNSGSEVIFTGDGDSAADNYRLNKWGNNYHHLTASSTDGANDVFFLDANTDANGNVVINAGTFHASTTFNLNVAGNWTNSGTFTAANGKVIFDDGTSSSTFTGASTFYDLTSETSGKELFFTPGSSTTITNTWTLTGASGDEIKLRSTTDGSAWYVDPQGTNSVSFVDVKDSNNINATAVECTSCIDSGGNTNWNFPVASTAGTFNCITPPPFSVSINNDEPETESREVTLNFRASDVNVVIYGEDSTFEESRYESYEPTKNYTLSSGEGEKTIYARFDGTRICSAVAKRVVEASITYKPPEAPAEIPEEVPTSTPATSTKEEATTTPVTEISPLQILEKQVDTLNDVVKQLKDLFIKIIEGRIEEIISRLQALR